MYYASIHQTKRKTDRNFILPLTAFEAMAEKLKTLDKGERLKIPGMIPMRVEMIVVAVCLIGNILRHFETKELVCSTYALKEGVIAQLLHAREALFIS